MYREVLDFETAYLHAGDYDGEATNDAIMNR